MINNILKVVGVEGSSNEQSANGYDHNNDRRTTMSSTNTNTNTNNKSNSSSSNNNNFASVVGGLINNFQDTIFDGSRNGLDGTSLMDASGRGGGSGRYNKNLSKGGRTYYIDGRINRRLQQSFQNKSGKNNNNALPKNRKFSGGKLPSSLNTNVYMGRKMIADVNDLYDILNDQQAYDNYDTLMEITSCAQTEAATVLSADYSSSAGGAAAAGGSSSNSNSNNSNSNNYNSNNKESSQEQKQNWARAKEEELVDCMLSQFPVSTHVFEGATCVQTCDIISS